MIADYWILRRRQLSLADLYKHEGRYAYSGGWNWRAIAAVLIGVIPVLPGFLKAATTPGFVGFENPTFIEGLYSYGDRKSTRLNSSHANISYAVFCLR